MKLFNYKTLSQPVCGLKAVLSNRLNNSFQPLKLIGILSFEGRETRKALIMRAGQRLGSHLNGVSLSLLSFEQALVASSGNLRPEKPKLN